MERQHMLHLTVMFIVAVVAIVSVAAISLNGKAADSPGFNRGLGSHCTDDSQCASGHCDGQILLQNGKTVEGVKVCT